MPAFRPEMDRFNDSWEEDADGCHIWTRSVFNSGYAQFHPHKPRTPVIAHRWLFKRVHGFLPEVVMHHCDKPLCVRLSCLMPGTHAENAQDRQRKGRGRKSRVDLDALAKIKHLPRAEIAATLGVSESTVFRMLRTLD